MMKLRQKYTLVITLILTVAFAVIFNMPAKAYAEGDYECLIIDDAELLSESEENVLMNHMQALLPYGNVIFQTVELESGDYEKYCENTYYDNFQNDPGVIFQIDMGNRKLTLSTSTALDEVVAPERDSIVDNVYEYASDEDYLSCAAECFDEVYKVLNDGTIAHNMKYIDNGIIAIILSLILNFIIVFASGKKKASTNKILEGAVTHGDITNVKITKGKLKKEYSPQATGSGSSGGGSSSGGGGGGGFSGGSSSHGF